MYKEEYRSAMEKISATPEFCARTQAAMQAQQNAGAPRAHKRRAVLAAAAVMLLLVPVAAWGLFAGGAKPGGLAANAQPRTALQNAKPEKAAAFATQQDTAQANAENSVQATAGEAAAQADVFYGTVRRVTQKRLLLCLPDGRLVLFAITPQTALPTGWLHAGEPVTVTAAPDGQAIPRAASIAEGA